MTIFTKTRFYNRDYTAAGFGDEHYYRRVIYDYRSDSDNQKL